MSVIYTYKVLAPFRELNKAGEVIYLKQNEKIVSKDFDQTVIALLLETHLIEQVGEPINEIKTEITEEKSNISNLSNNSKK